MRAPITDEERAKRMLARLNPRETELLYQWGYTYVFDGFRFHMTLTGMLSRPEAESVVLEMAELHAPLVAPRSISAICVCVQAHSDRCRLLRRIPLTGSGEAGAE